MPAPAVCQQRGLGSIGRIQTLHGTFPEGAAAPVKSHQEKLPGTLYVLARREPRQPLGICRRGLMIEGVGQFQAVGTEETVEAALLGQRFIDLPSADRIADAFPAACQPVLPVVAAGVLSGQLLEAHQSFMPETRAQGGAQLPLDRI